MAKGALNGEAVAPPQNGSNPNNRRRALGSPLLEVEELAQWLGVEQGLSVGRLPSAVCPSSRSASSCGSIPTRSPLGSTAGEWGWRRPRRRRGTRGIKVTPVVIRPTVLLYDRWVERHCPMTKREFGALRQLPSGRWQAKYRHPRYQ